MASPVIADPFHRMKYMERHGSGLRKIVRETEKPPGYTAAYNPKIFSTATDFRVILKNVNYQLNCAILRKHYFPICQFLHLLRIYSSAVSMFYQTIMISTRIRTGSHSSSARFTISCVLFCWLCSVGAFCDILLKAR